MGGARILKSIVQNLALCWKDFNLAAENLAYAMQSFGHKAAFYHASMESDERNYVQRRWSKDEISIICATVAFGMGK